MARTRTWSVHRRVCSFVLLLSCLCLASHARRVVCWHAILNCQAEPQCNYAYEHYTRACRLVLNGERKKCPSHCISSLIQLNLTKNGPPLEDCSCGQDSLCAQTKRAIEPCVPRTTSTGCTEARLQCGKDPQCNAAMLDYLTHCRKLFSGAICTPACRNVIAKMRQIPKGQLLDTCMCDGTERTICEFVKNSMKMLCFRDPYWTEASGADADEDYDGSYDDEEEPEDLESGAPFPPSWSFLTLMVSMLPLVPLFLF